MVLTISFSLRCTPYVTYRMALHLGFFTMSGFLLFRCTKVRDRSGGSIRNLNRRISNCDPINRHGPASESSPITLRKFAYPAVTSLRLSSLSSRFRNRALRRISKIPFSIRT
jgi:hypothetical protein